MTTTNPFVGVGYHWLGGLAAASFYIPYKAVRGWSWETYWLVGGFFSWIVAPLLMAWLLIPDFVSVLRESPASSIGYAFLFGLLWGIGGLTFGLTMRFLGIALGYAVALGMCAAFGTLVPPLFDGSLWKMFGDKPGLMTLGGVAICLLGIVFSGLAGTSKERELTIEQKSNAITEFHFLKGMTVAVFCGVLSAAMAFGLSAAGPIAAIAKNHLLQHGQSDLWQGLPGLIVILLGGFLTNFVWCVYLNVKNRSGFQYVKFRSREVTELAAVETVVPSTAADQRLQPAEISAAPEHISGIKNYILSAAAGVTWYLQFFFYSMGQARMGHYGFSSWTLHMASIILFSTFWGIVLKEWTQTSVRTKALVAAGIFVLILSTVVIGYGSYLSAST